MNDEFVRNHINSAGESLLDEFIVLNFRYHIIETERGGTSVLSRGASERDKWDRNEYVSVFEYIETLRHHDYSFLLDDGGIIQISFHFDDSEIQEYRYVYFPCPVRYLKDDYFERDREHSRHDQNHDWHSKAQEDGWGNDQYSRGYEGDEYRMTCIQDRVDKLLGHLISLKAFQPKIVMMAPLRFEWSRGAKTTNEGEEELRSEPESHVHLGFSKGRLAVSRPLTLWAFMSFVFKHYYHNEYKIFEESSKLAKARKCKIPSVDDDCILSSVEKFPFYIKTDM